MEFLPQMEEQRLRGCFNFRRFYRLRLDFPRRLGNRFHSSREKTLGDGRGPNYHSEYEFFSTYAYFLKGRQLFSSTDKQNERIRKSKGDSSEPGSKTGLKKLRIELNDLTFSLRNPLSLVPILSKSLKCNSPKTVVNKKAKSSRMTCLFSIHFMWVVLGIWSWMQTISNS